MGSPSTTANGISVCCGGSGVSASASSCEPVFSMSFSSGFIGFARERRRSSCPSSRSSSVIHPHRLMHFFERLARHVACTLAAFRDDAADEVAILLEFACALANRGDLRHDAIRQTLFAIEATDAGAAAALLHP